MLQEQLSNVDGQLCFKDFLIYYTCWLVLGKIYLITFIEMSYLIFRASEFNAEEDLLVWHSFQVKAVFLYGLSPISYKDIAPKLVLLRQHCLANIIKHIYETCLVYFPYKLRKGWRQADLTFCLSLRSVCLLFNKSSIWASLLCLEFW